LPVCLRQRLLPKPVTNELGLGILIYKEVEW